MKRIFKSGLSIFLAITIIFSSAYVGLNEIDLSGVFEIKAEAASVNDLTFELNKDGKSYSVTDCDRTAEGEIVIPDTYNGLPITIIGYDAFLNCEKITSVKIPYGVTYISYGAFYNCLNLISVIFPNSITGIGDSAFYNCDSLVSIDIPDSVETIGYGAFMSCENLASVTLGNGIISIGYYAFENTAYYNDENNWKNGVLYVGNYLLTADISICGRYNIIDGTKCIGDKAFYNCTELTTIEIPNSVISIGESSFKECKSLDNVFISDLSSWCNISFQDIYSNPLYLADNLFVSGELTKTIEIPKDVTHIPAYAFHSCKSLISIIIPDTVKNIGGSAFWGCTNLKSVIIGKGITNIYDYAFYFCENLSYVFYNGNSKEWLAITIGSNNSDLIEANFHYESTDHTLSDWKVTKVATCTTEGIMQKECTICKLVTETQVITKTGHKHSDWLTDKKATVYSTGSKYKECTECGEVLETAEIPQLKCSKPKLKTISNTEHGVKITWGKVSGADRYRVYRKTSKSDWKYIGYASKTGYTDKTAKSGTKYYYAVKARNEAGDSSLSSSLSKFYLADPTLKTPSSTKSGVKLTWNKIGGAEGYMVYRKTGTGSYSRIATVKGSTKVTYTDKSAKKGKTYTYKVKAYKSKTYSAYSNAKKIKDKY